MKFIGFISQYKGEEKDTYYWYFFQFNKLSPQIFHGYNDEFMETYNSNKKSIIILICEEFIKLEKDVEFPGEKNITHKENIQKIKNYIQWGLEQKDSQRVISKAIPCIKAMKLIYEEIANEEERLPLLFLAKSMHTIVTEEINLK